MCAAPGHGGAVPLLGALNAFHGVPWDLRTSPDSGRPELPEGRPGAGPHVGSNLSARVPVHVGRSVPGGVPTAAEEEARAEVVAGPLPSRLPYVTRALVEAHGRTLGCPKCDGSATLPHNEACRRRFAGLSLEQEAPQEQLRPRALRRPPWEARHKISSRQRATLELRRGLPSTLRRVPMTPWMTSSPSRSAHLCARHHPGGLRGPAAQ